LTGCFLLIILSPQEINMSKTKPRRVVVTGMGIVSPLGPSAPDTWKAAVRGQSGIGPITQFDASEYETRIAGEVRNFNPSDFMTPKNAARMDRFSQLAVAASRQALTDSGLVVNESNQTEIGTLIGSGLGGMRTIYEQNRTLFEKGPRRISPFIMPMVTLDMAAAQVSIVLGLKGINFGISSACATGTDSVGLAFELIRGGGLPVMLAGGTDASVNPIAVAGYNALNALSTRNDSPTTASRPFDATRNGFIISEGAAVLVLEEMEYALRREARIIAEVTGYGATADANHITHPAENGEGGVRSMEMALTCAGLKPTDIDYINAHGTSTQINDKAETQAIKEVFGAYAYKVAVSSTKSMTGHLIGAAGALEAAFCVMAIRDGIIPPTINLDNPDPECDLDYVPNKARKKRIKTALSNSFGFGGRNSTIILSEFLKQ
jgi:3-oxoacyl-[acyl-carrier-protein] synthase II